MQSNLGGFGDHTLPVEVNGSPVLRFVRVVAKTCGPLPSLRKSRDATYDVCMNILSPLSQDSLATGLADFHLAIEETDLIGMASDSPALLHAIAFLV